MAPAPEIEPAPVIAILPAVSTPVDVNDPAVIFPVIEILVPDIDENVIVVVASAEVLIDVGPVIVPPTTKFPVIEIDVPESVDILNVVTASVPKDPTMP